MEMEEEMERIRRWYEEMIEEEESTYQHQMQLLHDIYNKILLNQSLAVEFRANFMEHRSSSLSFQSKNQVPGPTPRPPPQPRTPQQIQRTSSPTAVAARQGSANARGSLCIPTNSSRPPPDAGPHMSASAPTQDALTKESLMASFGNGSGTGQVAADGDDGVVCLSDDD